MSRSTEQLIAALAADAGPVRRLRPPMIRAFGWIAAAAAVAVLAVAAFADVPEFLERAARPQLALELAATLLTALAAIVAAFHLSLPDRSRAWALLPLPPLALWLALSGSSCLLAWARGGPTGGGAHCLMFILAVSLPTGALLFWSLAKARPIAPGLTAATGGLGVAAASALLLQFFHPFDVTITDLALHLVAVLAVVAVACMFGRRALT